MARGIEKSPIFKDDIDRTHFAKRLGKIVSDTHTDCLAWALMPNHFHLLLKTDQTHLSTFMRRLLTGHALWFNKRHGRSGHLFQNRFKSILCQEEIYFLELVRYIHLNPLRANLVEDSEALSRYTFCGHGVLLGNITCDWQKTATVLNHFNHKTFIARRMYRQFVAKGIAQGKRADLTGGGLVRSAGGWTALKALRRTKRFQVGDERILGDGNFVESILVSVNESIENKYFLLSSGYDLDTVAKRVADIMGIETEKVWAPGRNRQTVEARSCLCYWAVRELGMSMASLARKLNLSITAVSKSVARGENIVAKKNVSLVDIK
jgi:REP-associated tyrosine transposase